MGGKSPENKATARVKAPADLGLLIQRATALTEGALDLLEADYVEFQANGRGVPKGFMDQLQSAVESLNSLSLSYQRFRKTEDEWAGRLSTEEKMDQMQAFLMAVYKETPEIVVKWLRSTTTLVNRAGDTVRNDAWSARMNRVERPDEELPVIEPDPTDWNID
jgi:hypothetical protein